MDPKQRWKKASRTAITLLGSVDAISARRDTVLKKWSDFKAVAEQRRARLEDSKRLQQFTRDAQELETWIAGKLTVASDSAHSDTTNLQGKINQHKTFVDEVHANENVLTHIKAAGQDLISGKHFASSAIAAKLESLEEQWQMLLTKSQDKGQKLQEAQQLVAFKREADEVEAWIQSKMSTAQSTDSGKDLEHVELLQKKFDDFTTDLSASDARVDTVTKMAADLVQAGHGEQAFIVQRQQAISDAWVQLKRAAAERHERLSNAKQIHIFTRDADEINGRVSEKEAVLASDDFGKDLTSVESLQRKHEAFARDLAALGDSVSSLGDAARRLMSSFPDQAEVVRAGLQSITDRWDALSAKAASRKARLDDAHDYQSFMNDFQTSMSWIQDIGDLMQADELAKDVAGADVLLQRHQEHHDEIDARQATFNQVVDFGQSLILRSHYARDELEKCLTDLKEARKRLDTDWHERQKQLQESRDLQVFLRDAEQLDAWIASRETVLSTDDVGDSLDTVEVLIKKHDDFEKTLAAHADKAANLQRAAQKLMDQDHSQADTIKDKVAKVIERREKLDQLSQERKTKLQDSKHLQVFKRDADEAEAWMKEKLQTASDQTFKDPTNLRGKVKNHEAFDAELSANQSRLNAVKEQGQQLTAQGHFASDAVAARLDQLQAQWEELGTVSKDKGRKLGEAQQFQDFTRRVDDMESWCKDVERALASEDLGRDLTSVQNLIKKHQLLEADVQGHKDRVDAVVQSADDMIKSQHFQADAIELRRQALVARYSAFAPPLESRKAKLQESLLLQKFQRLVDDEESWIREKLPVASSTNLGASLTAVNNLQKKHNAVAAELAGRQSHIDEIKAKAQDLLGASHYASDLVRTRQGALLSAWDELAAAADARRAALEDAKQAQQYFADAHEAQAWMSEKEPLVRNDNYGKDEDSTVALLKKHEALVQDLRTYNADIERLAADSQRCKMSSVQSSPGQSPPKAGQQKVAAQFKFDPAGDTKKLAMAKGDVLTLVSKDSADWWRCEKDGVVGFVPASYVREVAEPIKTQPTTDAPMSGTSKSISERQDAIEGQYKELLDLAANRRKRLEETLQLFQFNREIDEVETWMNTQEAIASNEEVGNDLEHNEVIRKNFDDFLKDLAANETRVKVANDLADKLVEANHTDSPAILGRRDAINTRWQQLQDLATQRTNTLSSAKDIHQFNRDVEETKARFNEKNVVLSYSDLGTDVASVEALQRKHDTAIRDLLALEGKVTTLRDETARLASEQMGKAAEVQASMKEVEDGWQALQNKAQTRKLQLEEALSLQRLVADHRDLTSWMTGMKTLAGSDELATDAAGAEALLKRHQELQLEIDARAEAIQKFRVFATSLVDGGHSNSSDINSKLEQLDAGLADLAGIMQARRLKLDQCHELQAFNRLAEQAEAWMNTRELAVASEDVSKTLDGVEAMLQKHGDLLRAIDAQSDKVKEVGEVADRLVSGSHYDAINVGNRKLTINERWGQLQNKAADRKALLDKTLKIQQLYRNANEAEAWLSEKLQIAGDPSFKDPSNLQAKAQKHQAFETEVAANKDRIFAVIEGLKQVKYDLPGEEATIQGRIDSLEGQWQSLCNASADKAQKLREASSQQDFNVGVEDVDFWLGEVELQLSMKELGKDLPAVQSLIDKHELVEADIKAHQARVDAINAQAQGFVDASHFDADSIQLKQKQINARFAAIQELAATRRGVLEESQRLQQILRDIYDEEAWIREKERVAGSKDFGRDLTGVRNLQRKHQAFASELVNHNERVSRVLSVADKLVADGHYDAATIASRKADLAQLWESLQALSEQRNTMLVQSEKFQMFQAAAEEEESWMNEKLAMLSSSEQVDTLSGAQALVKKHAAFLDDAEERRRAMDAVHEQGRQLAAEKNFNSEAIKATSQRIEAVASKLHADAKARGVALDDRLQFLSFSREADSIVAWIEDKLPQVASGEAGKDLAAVQALRAKQDTLAAACNTFRERIASFQQLSQKLIAGENSHAAEINAREAAVVAKWNALLEQAETRMAQLERSLATFEEIDDLFLKFAQKASQFNSWFENAEEDLTDPVRVNSLDEIHELHRAHQQFMLSLEAARGDFQELVTLNKRIATFTDANNPYTWFTIDTLQESWGNLEQVIGDREADLKVELQRQEENEKLRLEFAAAAKSFSSWLSDTRRLLTESTDTLEAQLELTRRKHEEIKARKANLKDIEELGARMEDKLILDNKHTEHTTVGLAQQWDQLEQLGMRMQHNLEQQIQEKNDKGVSQEQLKEFRDTFNYFDGDQSGYLDHQEFKSCLRSLGYVFAVVDEGVKDPEFEALLSTIDASRDGAVSQAEFMSFMISRETANVESSSEVVSAFKSAASEKPYVTREDLIKVLSEPEVEYCLRNMPQYHDPSGAAIPGALDYQTFTREIFLG
eukprot:m.361515 g.361515  ORF g.361515 m.361515 type:complete len:2425 (-) comp19658_c0_seq1:287-7561(-)